LGQQKSAKATLAQCSNF